MITFEQWWQETACQIPFSAFKEDAIKIAASAGFAAGFGVAKTADDPLTVLMPAQNVPCSDHIVESNVQLLRERSNVGLGKYGTTLASSGLGLAVLLRHALEESLDNANYLQAALEEIKRNEKPPVPDPWTEIKFPKN